MGRNLFHKVIQLIRSDDYRENLRRRSAEAAANNTNHSRLYRIAPELLATINDHLPLASGLALRLTCSKFYWSSVFNHSQRCADRADRFEALCMLECDGTVKGYCCRGCLKRHRYTAFSNEELAKKAHTRYCLATMKCFRVGVLRELSFADVKAHLYEQGKCGPKYKFLGGCNDQATLVSREVFIYSYHRRRRIYTSIDICRTSQLYSGNFVNLCKSLNIPLCPHMTMGDEEVAELLFQKKIYPYHRCKRCKTKVELHLSGPMTYFRVSRNLGMLSSPKDPTWLAHTFASKDPLLDTHCKAVRDWQRKNPINSRKPLRQLQLLQHKKSRTPDFSNLFTNVTLPRSRWSKWFYKRAAG
ncbi:hypothetical protein GX50_08454 [[Emmonsia] crescens]|uniref:Uncharacterized protein n=1 Tax=[Emmonsia] crescens TaxID=73230 RepID=A0A2B7Z5W6_9EURO|nr:hypothetical protein GX50_08454 [Emmonsia crescens]